MAADVPTIVGQYITVPVALLVVLASVLVLLIAKWMKQSNDAKGFPPSPPRLPLIGNYHYFLKGKCFFEVVAELKQKYGPIFTLWTGSRPVIIITNQKLIREAFVSLGHSTSGRAELPIIARSSSRGGKGIALATHSKQQIANRKFGSSSLQDLFSNRNEAASVLLDEECKRLIKSLLTPFDVNKLFYDVTIRVICGTCLGPAFIESENNIAAVKSFVHRFFSAFSLPVSLAVNACPLLQHLPLLKLNSAKLHRKERDALLEKEYRKHRALLETSDYQECCVLDKLLLLGEEQFSEDDSIVIVHDLITAGSETVSTTLYWATFCLITHSDWQKKLQAEVDANVSTASELRTSDSASFPKLRAFTHEVQRWSSAVSNSIGHVSTEDLVLAGYHIPKKTSFMASLQCMHYDESYWPNPAQFDPARFLDDDGRFVIPNKSFLPFSIGPRSCPGDRLAKRELFFILLYMLYYIDIHPEIENQFPPFEFVECSTLQPKPFNIRISPRVSLAE